MWNFGALVKALLNLLLALFGTPSVRSGRLQPIPISVTTPRHRRSRS